MTIWTVESWVTTGDFGRMGLEEIYAGHSITQALFAMFNEKRKGVKVIVMTMRP